MSKMTFFACSSSTIFRIYNIPTLIGCKQKTIQYFELIFFVGVTNMLKLKNMQKKQHILIMMKVDLFPLWAHSAKVHQLYTTLETN